MVQHLCRASQVVERDGNGNLGMRADWGRGLGHHQISNANEPQATPSRAGQPSASGTARWCIGCRDPSDAAAQWKEADCARSSALCTLFANESASDECWLLARIGQIVTCRQANLTRERRRSNAFGRRGINAGRVTRRPASDCLPTARTEIFDRGTDRLCHNQAALRCSELKLFLPVHDRSGFQQYCRHERTV